MTADHLEQIWNPVAADLRDAVGASMFDIWLASLAPAAFDGRDLVLCAPDETRDWVAERFGRVLQASCAAVLGPEVTVHLQGGRRDAPAPLAADRAPAAMHDEPALPDVALNPKYVFDQFVIGSSNRFAHAAALAVAENPGTAYNPLVLCGPPGVGKTHLLHAIGDYLTRYGDGLRVRATTGEAFANEFISAVRTKRTAAFKARHRDVDVLLVDDVQFLMAKARTEEEFFHTFNALRDAGAQIVLTSDRTPEDLDGLEDRLRDRFRSGLVAGITPPDSGTRLAALRKRAALDGLDVEDERVLEVVARRAPANIRSLEGALIRVVAFSSLTGRPRDAALAEEVLDDLGVGRRPEVGAPAGPTIEQVQQLTCETFGITEEELLSSSREGRVAWPRQVAMYLARRHTDASLPVIGREFGGRGHTTVLHACRRTEERLAGDLEASKVVGDLSTRLSKRVAGDGGDRSD